MHSLHAAPSERIEIDAIRTDAPNGKSVARTRKPVARRSPSRLVTSNVAAKNARNAKTLIAGSAIGIPPQNVLRKSDEYGLIRVAPQPEFPTASSAPRPGTN